MNSEQQLLEKAKADYPKGTVYKDAEYPQHMGNKMVTEESYEFYSAPGEYGIVAMDGSVYYNGKWAEIISKPENK